MATLDPRLLAASQMIIPRSAVADIGTDHGQLPIYLLAAGISPRVIATEWGDSPYRRACDNIRHSPCSGSIEVRQGYGLEPLQPAEVKTVVIMGMGGDLVADILGRDWLHSASFERVVLQPMSRPVTVRRILAARGWDLLEERVVRLRNRFFILMSYCPGSRPYRLTPLQEQVGPHILRSCGSAELAYLSYCRSRFKNLADSLALSSLVATRPKHNLYQSMCQELEDIINDKHG
jgi:tRNA (adenine22-N1)-methyltransferase